MVEVGEGEVVLQVAPDHLLLGHLELAQAAVLSYMLAGVGVVTDTPMEEEEVVDIMEGEAEEGVHGDRRLVEEEAVPQSFIIAC